MKKSGWIISQEWHDVLFIHHEIQKEVLEKLVPFPLDLFNGKAYVSIVPFRMEKIRFPYLPAVPGLSSLWELNLRTYVEVDGVNGIYFFTLDTDSLFGEFIARKFFHLPYNHAKLQAKVSNDSYYFEHQREKLSLKLNAKIRALRPSSTFDLWATERYSLFTFDQHFFYEGKVHHKPWKLQEAELIKMEDHFSSMLGESILGEAISVSYCQKLEVRFSPFKKVGRIHESI